jgi:hypothetical protein
MEEYVGHRVEQSDLSRFPVDGDVTMNTLNRVGRRGEEAAMIVLRSMYAAVADIKDVSAQNLGWDLEVDAKTGVRRVEVKSTIGDRLAEVELTPREWEAARQHGNSYWLALVVDCLGNPVVSFLRDPAAQVSKGLLEVRASRYLLSGFGQLLGRRNKSVVEGVPDNDSWEKENI